MSGFTFSTFSTDEYIPDDRIVESSQYDSTIDSSFASTTTQQRSLFAPASWPSSSDYLLDSGVFPRLDEPTSMMAQSESSDLSSEDILTMKMPSFPFFIEKFSENESESIGGNRSFSEDEETSCSELDEIEIEECESSASSASSDPSLEIVPVELQIELPISEKKLKKLCFDEKLVISKVESSQKPENFTQLVGESCEKTDVGSMLISVQNEQNKVIIYSKSHFSFENNKEVNCSILSVVDEMLQLVEEKRTESLLWGNRLREKSLHVTKEENKITIFQTSTRNGCVKKRQRTMKASSIGDLILDGGSLLLMRYLVEKKFIGDFEVWTMHIKGELCRSLYNVRQQQPITIRKHVVMPVSITKTIYRKNKTPSISETYFLPTGHILQHRWQNCKFFIRLDDDLLGFPPCVYVERLENRWHENLLLQSKFQDMKSQYQAEIKSYLDDNSEIQRMLEDYLFHVLENKPDNILDFTVEYFRCLYYGGGIVGERQKGDGAEEEEEESEENDDEKTDIDEFNAKPTDLQF